MSFEPFFLTFTTTLCGAKSANVRAFHQGLGGLQQQRKANHAVKEPCCSMFKSTISVKTKAWKIQENASKNKFQKKGWPETKKITVDGFVCCSSKKFNTFEKQIDTMKGVAAGRLVVLGLAAGCRGNNEWEMCSRKEQQNLTDTHLRVVPFGNQILTSLRLGVKVEELNQDRIRNMR